MFISLLPVLGILLAGLFIFLMLIALVCVLAFFLPYFVWLSIQNSKGKHFELAGDISTDEQILNTFKWWKSLFTHKPAF